MTLVYCSLVFLIPIKPTGLTIAKGNLLTSGKWCLLDLLLRKSITHIQITHRKEFVLGVREDAGQTRRVIKKAKIMGMVDHTGEGNMPRKVPFFL